MKQLKSDQSLDKLAKFPENPFEETLKKLRKLYQEEISENLKKIFSEDKELENFPTDLLLIIAGYCSRPLSTGGN